MFSILILVYIISHIIMNRTKRRKYAFFLSEVFFLLSGYILTLLLRNSVSSSFIHYSRILATILITLIAFTSSLQFRNRLIKRIPRPFIVLSTSAIILMGIAIYLMWCFFVKSWNINSIMLAVFLSGISFTFIDIKASNRARRMSMTGIISPMIYSVLWIIIFTLSLITGHITFNPYIFTYIAALFAVILLINYLSVLLSFNEWTIVVLAVIMIITSFSIHFSIAPMLAVFVVGYFITNRSTVFSDRFFGRFAASEKPAYFLLLLIAGSFMILDIRYLLAAVILMILKAAVYGMLFGRIIKNQLGAFSAVGISGFELIGCMSLFLMNIINGQTLAFFIVFMLLSQLIQMAVIYADDTQ